MIKGTARKSRQRSVGTRDIPLKFAAELSRLVSNEWGNGVFMAKASPVTQDLLRFWFADSFVQTRQGFNFHIGQKQAILNAIYAHEILKAGSVFEVYEAVNASAPGNDFMGAMDLSVLRKEKFIYPKYCMKMATGTGKTWVLAALLIWQYLNSKHEDKPSGRYSKNFLVVAPGLIVYERLLDSYLGKEREDGSRDFATSDFYSARELFIPDAYREEMLGFIQSSVVRKDEIGRKITGDGLIAITNWHRLVDEDEPQDADEVNPLDNPTAAVKEMFPVTPGTSQGQALDTLDSKFLRGGELEYLVGLPNLTVFNDEAHHLGDKDADEKKWQESLNLIAKNKGIRFIQIDFSATPYDVHGSGQTRTKHYFPHIVVDFSLNTAIHAGLVKTITIDRRIELNAPDLKFKAVRDANNKAIGLSEGQRLMLRAGLEKLRRLEASFTSFQPDKHPKMLVICEDTSVSPQVVDFLTASEGLQSDEVMQIDSDRKGSIPQKEWAQVRQRLFNLDKHEKPKVVVSVLMLREGFDVNNICVIVPLRSSEAPILLEQVIGRGLRLMWREPVYTDIKAENRHRLLIEKKPPENYLDILSIVEHPAFIQFYEDLNDSDIPQIENDPTNTQSILGDLITVGLKENYQEYDLYWPVITKEREEFLEEMPLDTSTMKPVDWYELAQLKKMVKSKGEVFVSEELTVKTRFGEYEVTADLFSAKSYNEFLAKIATIVTSNIGRVSQRRERVFPVMQVNLVSLVRLIDTFIRRKLFKQEFDPLEDNNWRVLLMSEAKIVQHILTEVGTAIYNMQNNSIRVEDATISRRFFSQLVPELKMRESFALDITKTVYEKLAYPPNKGELEKNFMLACDLDTNVEAFVKIYDYKHDFAAISYIRTDGIFTGYHPDFLLRMADGYYIVETKADRDLTEDNVRQKRKSAMDWVKRLNELPSEVRDNREWHYTLLGENSFYTLQGNGASIKDILENTALTQVRFSQTLMGKLL